MRHKSRITTSSLCRGPAKIGFFGFFLLAVLVVAFWTWILAVLVVAGAGQRGYRGWSSSDFSPSRIPAEGGVAARADAQHQAILEGDVETGTYGEYPPAV